MDFPIKIDVSIKQKNLKAREIGQDVAMELAMNQIMDKIRRMNLVKIDENSFEITARANFTISMPMVVKG
jgi:hypothetical protein